MNKCKNTSKEIANSKLMVNRMKNFMIKMQNLNTFLKKTSCKIENLKFH